MPFVDSHIRLKGNSGQIRKIKITIVTVIYISKVHTIQTIALLLIKYVHTKIAKILQ